MKPAIFLDRDGVIIQNRANYVRSWKDVVFYPQALNALKAVSETSYSIVVVTNQSVVGRGYISRDQADEINSYLVRHVEAAGGRIDAVFMCPHAPSQNCLCRKPRPGLLLQAAERLAIDLGRSIMIGDALTDLAAGRAAGVGQLALLKTGRGAAQSQMAEAESLRPFSIFNHLREALSSVL